MITWVKNRVVPAYPEPYVRKRKRGRPKKNGRPKKDRWQEMRASPSKRTGSRFRSVSVPEDMYFMLHEMSLFYKATKSSLLVNMIKPAFEKAHKESLTLQRINENRQKEAPDEVPDGDSPARRTHF